ncbi:MAG TPA: Mth938-like domain-containing protein [Roseiarcus sp.]
MTGTLSRPAFAPGSHPIAAYGEGAFAFAGMSHAGSILATPEGVRTIQAAGVADLDEIALAPLIAECAERPGSIELLIVGTGARIAPLGQPLRDVLKRAGLRFEAMATGPALRVYNVMQSENRRVAAALIAAP